MTYTTHILADFVLRQSPGDIPASAKEMALNCMLDLLGVALAGYRTNAVRAMRALIM